jgi:hypothetical protein
MKTTHLRVLAASLACGGVVWGLLCLPLLLDVDSPLKVVNLGLGYLVTGGYLVRCLSMPSLTSRRIIWGGSALVQGTWLASLIAATAARRGWLGNLDLPALVVMGGWWALSCAASVYGLVVESREGECP